MSNQDNHSPAFQFYPKDFIGSERVAEMTYAELGIYIRLLCLCWTNEGIKQDARLDRIIGPEWDAASEVVMPCFEVIDGKLWNPRLYRELKKQKAHAKGKSKAGKASAKARKSRKCKEKEHVLNSVEVPLQQNSTLHTPYSILHTPNNPQAPKGDDELFEDFWKSWPKHKRKTGKAQAKRKWGTKGCAGMVDKVMATLEVYKASGDWSKDGGEYIPAPTVWLNREPWEAEVLPPPADRSQMTEAQRIEQSKIDLENYERKCRESNQRAIDRFKQEQSQ